MPSELTLSVNGEKHVVSAPTRHAAALRPAQRTETDRPASRLRHGPVRRLRRAARRRRSPRVRHAALLCGWQTDHHHRRPPRRVGRAERFERCRRRQNPASRPTSVDRRTSPAMRLLPKRHDDRRGAVARQESKSNGGANQGRLHQYAAVTSSLPLRHLHRHHRRRATRRQGHEIVKQESLMRTNAMIRKRILPPTLRSQPPSPGAAS